MPVALIHPNLGRHIDDADSTFERGVLNSLYRGRDQRRRRALLWTLLIAKHVVRGVLFSWPLYLLGSAAWLLPQGAGWALAAMFLPALAVSGWILWQGLSEDRAAYLDGVILKPGAVWRIAAGRCD